IANPLEREHQIENPDVTRLRIFGPAEARGVEVPEDVQSMIDGNDDNIAAPTQPRAVIERARARAAAELAAMKVDEHGTLAAVAQRRRPDIQAQTILARWLARVRLRTRRTVIECLAHFLPRCRRDSGQETPRARRRAIGNAFEDVHAVEPHAG